MSGALAFASFGISLLEEQERRRAVKADARELKRQATELGYEARDREIARRRDLNRILSTQAAQFAGSGLSMIGSPAAIMQSSAANAQQDFMADRAQTVRQQKQLRAQASAMKKAQRRGAFTRVIGSALKSYASGSGGGG